MTNDDFLTNLITGSGDPVTPPLNNEPEPPEIESPSDSTPPSDSSVDPQFKAYIDFLSSNNILDLPEEDFELSPDNLEQAFEYTKKKRYEQATNELLNSLPEDFQPVLQYALNGGTDIRGFVQRIADDPLKNLDITTEEGQKQVIYQNLKETSNYTDERINRIVSRMAQDPDELAAEAAASYQELVSLKEQQRNDLIQQAKEAREEQERQIQQRTVALNSAIESTQAVHPQRRQKIKAFFFEPVQTNEGVTTSFNLAIQAILNNPEHQAQLGDILLDYDSAKGFSLDRFEKRATTKASKDFQSKLRTALNPGAVSNSGGQPRGGGEFNWSSI